MQRPWNRAWILLFVAVVPLLLAHQSAVAAMADEACREGESFTQYRARIGWPGEYSDVLNMNPRQVPAAWSNLDIVYSDCETCPVAQRPAASRSSRGPRKISEFHLNFFVHCIAGQPDLANRHVGHFADEHARPACPSDRQLAAYFGSSGGDGTAQLAASRRRLTQESAPHYWGISDFMGARDCMLARAVRQWQRQCYYVKNRRVRSAELASCPNEFDGSNALLCADGSQEDSPFCRAVSQGLIATRARPDQRINQRSAKGGSDDVRESSDSAPAKSAGSADGQ